MKSCFFTLVFPLLATSPPFCALRTECSLPNSVTGRGTVEAVCVGDRAVFACNASYPTTLALRWQVAGKVNDFFHFDAFPVREASPFTFILTSSTPVLASVAEIVVLESFNASSVDVACFNRDTWNQTLVKRGCLVLAAPPTVTDITLVSCTLSSVTVQWSSTSGVGPVDGYTLKRTRLQVADELSYFVEPERNSYTLTNIVPETWYNVSAQGTVCNRTQYGNRSGVTFAVSVSQYPRLKVCPVYNTLNGTEGGDTSQTASELRTVWNATQLDVKLKVGQGSVPCGRSTAGYTISYVCDQGRIPPASYYVERCSGDGELCSHAYDVNFASGTTCNVSLSSENLLLATAVKRAETRNSLLSVKLSSNVPPLSFSCLLFSDLIGTSGCSVSLGRSSDSLSYTSTSQRRGTQGDSVVVTFNETASLQPSTVYFYEAVLQSPSNDLQCAIVRGSFTTGTWCSFGTEVDERNEADCHCRNGSKSAAIANGCVCYTGILPGSKAYFTCNDESESSSRECMQDGKWSGASVVCGKAMTREPVSEAALGVAGIVGVAIGVAIVVAILLTITVVSLLTLRKTIDDRKRLQKKRRLCRARRTSIDLSQAKNDGPLLTVRVDHDGGHWMVPPSPSETVIYSTIKHC